MDRGSITRTVLLLLALINQGLTMTGHSVIPVDEEAIRQVISYGFLGVTSLWAWWKNNFISSKGKQQKAALEKKGLK